MDPRIQFKFSLSMEKQQQKKHLSFTSHQDLDLLQLQYLFVRWILNILSYPPFLNRNFPSKHLLKVPFSSTPMQRKTLWMKSVCSFFSFGSTTAEPQSAPLSENLWEANPYNTVMGPGRITLPSSGCQTKAHPRYQELVSDLSRLCVRP